MQIIQRQQKYFNRYEIKYQISLKERDNLISFIHPFMRLDPYVQNGNSYEVIFSLILFKILTYGEEKGGL